MREFIIVLLGLFMVGCGPRHSGPQGPQGAPGKDGSNGSNGAAGAVGPQGLAGPQGLSGVNGQPCTTIAIAGGVEISCPDGSHQDLLNGPAIRMVKLCTQYPDVYPSSFPEYAQCVGNDLYAVYWNGTQAFEAKIVPGTYASTSPQGCTFTVLPNCVVRD